MPPACRTWGRGIRPGRHEAGVSWTLLPATSCERAGASCRKDGKPHHSLSAMNLPGTINDAADKAKELLDDATAATTDKAKDLLDKAADVKHDLLDKAADLKDNLLDKAADAKDRLFGKAADVKEALADKAADAKEAVLDHTPSSLKKVGAKAADAFEDLTTTQKVVVAALLAAGLTYLLTRNKR